MSASGPRVPGRTAAIDDLVRRRVGQPWCLFLDRDGVINTRIVGGYVRTWDEFRFEPGALDALRVLAHWSPRIVVVTNQQGIGKGLMTRGDLRQVHLQMVRAIQNAGGRIDSIRFCPHLDADSCDCRKPSPGMATGYLDENNDLTGSLSVMVGDTSSDVEMGRRLAARNGGGATVRIHTDDDPAADLTSSSLAAFATEIRRAMGGYSAE
ncbi:D-glycero-alpha-D-manno-heptose-1,7-bisphosphate 7-phosphatase [Microbacterium testaceum]|uniref:D-glycero-alpha-D-manno-heptose-1,7-bisphosphate 7-phosphatase n=1 Tax=Microbacterium testaceum TaxID=2033 RepID=UPI0025B1404F|nr:HAD-IIIA family hydrolase [Microbacterium testaceum]WJS91738.1 HAD-IIIA family hydrolase [Microbacterium testaceum]